MNDTLSFCFSPFSLLFQCQSHLFLPVPILLVQSEPCVRVWNRDLQAEFLAQQCQRGTWQQVVQRRGGRRRAAQQELLWCSSGSQPMQAALLQDGEFLVVVTKAPCSAELGW